MFSFSVIQLKYTVGVEMIILINVNFILSLLLKKCYLD